MAPANGLFYRNLAVLAIIASGVAVLFSLVVVPYLTTSAQESPHEERLILAIDTKYDPATGRTLTKLHHVKVGEMESNAAYWFLDPFGRTMEAAANSNSKLRPGNTLNQSDSDLLMEYEPFEFYILIRLPDWLGGSVNELSAYRSYSAIAISDQCFSKYWSHEGRWRIENPCAGDFYRPWDGVATGGPAAVGITGRGIIMRGYFNGLASIDLSVDSEGYIMAKRPDKDYFANGVAGEGSRFTAEMMSKSNEEMIRAASEYSGYKLPFVSSISSTHYLSELRPTNEPTSLEYPDYEVPQLLEAVYFSSPSGGDYGYGEVIIRSYPLDVFPSLSLENFVMATDGIDPPGTEPDYREYAMLNGTNIESLVHLDWYDNVNNQTREIKSGSNIAGNFSVFIAPSKIGSDEGSLGAVALIWGKSIDGKKDLLVSIRADSLDMEELIALGKMIPLAG